MSPTRNSAENPARSPSDPGPSPLSARRYARALLGDCPLPAPAIPPGPDPHTESDAESHAKPTLDAARAWARSGAMALTGPANKAPHLAPGPLALAARGAALALASCAPGSRTLAELDGPALLGERAALMGLGRQGTVAPGGGCRLLGTEAGWLALNLARPEDRALLPAWLEVPARAGEDAWEFARRAMGARPLGPLIERGRLMGMAIAPVASAPTQPAPWLRFDSAGPSVAPPSPTRSPQVLDLSSLWAGPLCAQLLGASGAQVIKAESLRRPDGARRGNTPFFDLLNAGKHSVALELDQPGGVTALRGLIAQADIVVESARPRALAQLGIDARACLGAHPGQVWVSITGYGRNGEAGDWAGFGDDVAMAAGAAAGSAQAPLFCGDAIADPLTGLHAALAALTHWQSGAGGLLDLSLFGVTRHALAGGIGAIGGAQARAQVVAGAPDGGEAWQVVTPAGVEPVATPRARPSRGPAAELGRDTRRVLAPGS